MRVPTLAKVAISFSALSLLGAVSCGTRPDATPKMAAARERPAGEGVICAMGIYNAVAEVGRRCFPGRDAEFQAELGRTVSRIDDYVLANSGWTSEDLARFKREQSHVGEPEPIVCSEEMKGFYGHMAATSVETVRTEIDRLLARPGPPTWGTCL